MEKITRCSLMIFVYAVDYGIANRRWPSGHPLPPLSFPQGLNAPDARVEGLILMQSLDGKVWHLGWHGRKITIGLRRHAIHSPVGRLFVHADMHLRFNFLSWLVLRPIFSAAVH